MRVKIKYIIVCIFLVGCNGVSKDDVLKINPRDVKDEILLSGFVESVEAVRFLTPEDKPIGRTRHIYIRNKHIYVADLLRHSLFLFNRQGEFIAEFNRQGRGPGEYLRIGPVFIDENEETFEIMTHTSEGFGFLRFSLADFEYLDFTPSPLIFADTGVKLEETYYLANQHTFNIIDDKPNNASLVVLQKGEVLESFFNYEMDNDGRYMSFHTESFVLNDRNELFFSQMFDHNIYKIEENKPTPYIKLDFGNRSISNEIKSFSGREKLRYLEEANGLAAFPFLKAYSSDILMLSYLQIEPIKQNSPFVINHNSNRHYLKLKNNTTVLHAKKIKNDITSCPEYIFHGPEYRGVAFNVLHENYLIDILLPGNELREAAVCNMQSDDSRWLVFMKLK